jgi:probable rRNA maturation factor
MLERDEAERKGESEARGLGARRRRDDAVVIEVSNRSGVEVEEAAAAELAQRVLAAEGVDEGELGIAFVGPEESRTLKREHLGVDEPTDVLSFPIDGREALPAGLPRQLGDVVLCPQVVGDAWRRPLAHGLLHLLGYDHGAEMEKREEALSRWP